MSMSNRRLMQLADTVVADFASGGLLNPEQANAFIRKLIVQPTILREVRLVVMGAPQRKIEKIHFATRILRPGVENTSLAVGDRAVPTTETVTLTTFEVMAEVRISYDALEDQIERANINANNPNGPSTQPVSGGLKDTIITLMAERAATDLEELLITGDTGSGDPYLALVDGLLVQATSNVVDHGSQPITRSMFANGLVAMPPQYLRNKAAMRNYVSTDREIQYQDHLGGRETALGDARITQAGPVFGAGVPVMPVALMPNTSGLLVDPRNIIWGIQRQISVEVDKDISARNFKMVLTMRCDFKYEEELAVVKYTNVGT